MEFVGIGDLHLDKMAKLFPEDHHHLVFKEVQKAADYARSNSIRHVIQYGDVSETPYLSRESRKSLYRFLKENNDLEWWFILGNHDWGEEGIHALDELHLLTQLGFIQNVHVVTKPVVREIESVPFHFMPYPLKTVQKNCVNIAHVDINGFKSDSGRVLQSENVFPDDTLLLTGHLHTPQHQDPWYCVGTLYQTNFGESKEKGFHHVKVTKGRSGKLVWDVHHVPVKPEFTLENLIVEKRADLNQISKDPTVLYKLFIKSDVEIPDDLMTKRPNIVKLVGYSSKRELKSVMEDFLTIESGEETVYKPTEYLGEFLKSKGATKKQVARAFHLAGEKLGIELNTKE